MLNKISAGLSGVIFGKNIPRAFGWIPAAFTAHDEPSPVKMALMSLVRMVFGAEYIFTKQDIELIRSLFRNIQRHEADQLIRLISEGEFLSFEESVSEIALLPENKRLQTLEFLVTLAVRCRRLEQSMPMFQELAAATGIPAEQLEAMAEEQTRLNGQRQKIIQSGAGILVAIIVIAVFILTATLLRSVAFGLIAAFIMLPAEKYFERRLTAPKSILSVLFSAVSKIFYPVRRLSEIFRRSAPKVRDEAKIRTARAVSMTVLLIVLAAGGVLGVLYTLSANYVSDFKEKHQEQISVAAAAISAQRAEIAARQEADADPHRPEEAQVSASQDMERFFAPMLNALDNLRGKLDRVPLMQTALAELSKILNDEAAQRELVKMFLRRTGGLFSFTAGVLGGICNILLDILLTVFFFMLFLTKLAEFNGGKDRDGMEGAYLVRTVFSGSWLPGANEATIAEAEKIITEVINRLKRWMRGYFLLVMVDATIYTTLFYFLKVPYFFILGPLSGLAILLPYIGPIASTTLTVLVTLAVGGSSVSSMQILGILSGYLIYNAVIEQLILYPIIFGESLGLTTLETIIVVLLGAIFAGIPGMILALPTAAVLKYLVPQIYRCFGQKS